MYQKQIAFPWKLKRYTIASCWLVVSIRHFVLSIYYRHGILINLMLTHWLTPNYITISVFLCPYVCLSHSLNVFVSVYLFASWYHYLVVLIYTIILYWLHRVWYRSFCSGGVRIDQAKYTALGVLWYVPPGKF